jgi:purine-binding chemotaxis protein CheW
MTVAEAAPTTPDQMLAFSVGSEQYCVGIDAIAEIVAAGEITGLPETPPAIAGVMDLRGEMTTIVRPDEVFDVEASGDRQQVLVFEDGSTQVGWLVDKVHEVRQMPDAEYDPVTDNEYLNGLVSESDGFTIWVDAAAIHRSLPV